MGGAKGTLLVLLFALVACRKDPALSPVLQEALCHDLTEMTVVDGDTVRALTGEDNLIDVDLAAFASGSLHIECSGYYYFLSGEALWNSDDHVWVWPNDSIGFMGAVQSSCAFNSLLPGDTAFAYAPLARNFRLHSFNWKDHSTPCGAQHSTWYVGFVKIKNGQKYAGVLQLGSNDGTSGGRRYWVERVAMASCPGKAFIVC